MTDRRDRASGNGDHVVFDSVDDPRAADYEDGYDRYEHDYGDDHGESGYDPFDEPVVPERRRSDRPR